MTGRVPWNKGKTGIYSEKTKKQIGETLRGRVPWNKGLKGAQKHSERFKAQMSERMSGDNNPMKRPEVRTKQSGKTRSIETKTKISEALRGRTFSDEHRANLSGENNPSKRPEIRAKISASLIGRFTGENSPHFGKTRSPETRIKISAGHQGMTSEEWDGFISFEPYCPKFNNQLKENIRNRDGRTCQLCGKPEILNGKRLAVHHIDGEKMQGCDDKKWALVALCSPCNTKADTLEKEFLIVSNLSWRK